MRQTQRKDQLIHYCDRKTSEGKTHESICTQFAHQQTALS